MKKALFTILTLSIFYNLYSQDRLSVSINVAPILSNRFLKSKKDSVNKFVSSNDYIKGRDNQDRALLGFKAGINLIYRTSSNISIYSGITYLHQRVSHSLILPITRFETINGQLKLVMDKYGSYDANYNYLSIPVGVMIKVFNKDKFEIGFNGGLSFDYLISRKDINANVGVFPDQYESYVVKNFCTELTLGLESNYLVNKRMIMFFRPNFNYFLSPNLTDYNAISQNNYYFGLDIGLRYKINAR
jgi:hypothetical protein